MANIDKEKLYTIRFYIKKSFPEGEDKNEVIKILSDLIGDGETPMSNERETPDVNHKGRIKVAIIVGHEKRAPGATFAIQSKYLNEYDYNSAVANVCQNFIKMGAYNNVELKIIFRDGIGISGAYSVAKQWGPDCCIELHYNAFNEKVQGTETLVTVESQDKLFGQLVHNEMCKVFTRAGQSRGLKPISRGDRGGGNVYGLPGSANCLVEPFFGDNPVDAKMAVERMDSYAKSLIDGCVMWARSQGLIT